MNLRRYSLMHIDTCLPQLPYWCAYNRIDGLRVFRVEGTDEYLVGIYGRVFIDGQMATEQIKFSLVGLAEMHDPIGFIVLKMRAAVANLRAHYEKHKITFDDAGISF